MTTKHRAEVLVYELQRVEDSIVNHGLVHFCCVLADARIKLRTIPAMEAEIERLKKQSEPDMFWNHDDPEQSHSSVNDVVVSAYENGFLEVGDEIEIQQAITMENIKVKITLISDDGDLEWEEVE